MAKLDWEKQKKKELPKEYLNDMERHARKRASEKKSRLKKKAEEIKLKEKRLNANRSFEAGKEQQLERIIQKLSTRLYGLLPNSEIQSNEIQLLRDLIAELEREQK